MSDPQKPASQMTIPLVPCPYGDDQPVDLAYYLAHQADFCMHRGEYDNARLFQAAADWVRSNR